MTSSKKRKNKKRYFIFLLIACGLIVIWLIFEFFLIFQKTPASIYIFPENPKQGDTVFIRVKSSAAKITGNFSQEGLPFYKKGISQEWISFLGIDADQNPGDYKIFVDTSNAEHLIKEIKVVLASFSTGAVAVAPKNNQNKITNQKAIANIRNNDNPVLSKFLGNPTPQPYFTGPFSFPLSRMEKTGFSFGKFIRFAKDKIQHFGVDLRASEKTEIYAINDGNVLATLNLSNYGKTVIIDHGLNIFSLYLHLDEFKVTEGQMVSKGQSIGLSGGTGYVTAPHLHFSIRVGGARVDPISFIETTKKIDDNFVLADINEAFSNIFK